MLFLRRKKMALFLFDRGSRSKEHQKQQQQQQEEEKKRRSKLRHSRVEDGLYGCDVDSSSSSSNNKSSSKGRCMTKSESSPNITSLSSDFVTTDGTSKADVDRRPGRGSEAGGSWLSEGRGSSQEGGYNGYGDGGGVFPCQAPRRSLSPIGSSDWALRECELHTTWLNELRKCGGEEPITDLRSAVADGVTLVQLTKALTNCEVCVVEQDQRLSKSQAQVNLDRCLAQLAACGVDVIGIQAEALAEGDLKSTLLLLGQTRRRFDSTAAVRRSPAPNRNRQAHAGQGGGGGAAGGSFTETVTVHPHPTPHRLLLEMPGRAEASPQPQRSSNRRPDLSPTMRRAYQQENDRILPGLMTSDSHSSHSRQHSADHLDRRPAQPQPHHQHHHHINNASVPSPYQSPHAPPSSSQPHFAPRPHSSIGVTSAERPPSQLGVAWSAESSSKVRQTPDTAAGASGSAVTVEERIRQLVLDNQHSGRPVQYEDGELLVPPTPSRDFGDGVTLGGVTVDHSSTDGTRHFGQLGVDFTVRDQGYVPSAPSDRRPGPRGETMLQHSQASHYATRPGSLPSPTFSGSQKSTTSSVQKANDMRSTWNKLYGAASDWRPPSRPDVTSARRDSYGQEEIMLQQPPPGHTLQKLRASDVIPARNNSQSSSGFPGEYHSQSPALTPFPLQPRESPMGESNSTQGQTSDSSGRSSHSDQTVAVSTFKPPTGRVPSLGGIGKGDGLKVGGADDDDEEVARELRRTLGPASKYPAGGSAGVDKRPSSARLTPQLGSKFGLKDMFPSGRSSAGLNRTEVSSSPHLRYSPAPSFSNSRDHVNNRPTGASRVGESRNPMGGAKVNPAYAPDTEDEEEEAQRERGSLSRHQSHHALDKVESDFDYAANNASRRQLFTESESRSVTPPLPPLSPSSTQPGSAPSTPSQGGGAAGPETRTHSVDFTSAPPSYSAATANKNASLPSRPLSAQGYAKQAALRQRSDSALSVPALTGAETPDLLVSSATPGPEEKRAGDGVVGRRGGSPRGPLHHGSSSSLGAKNLSVPADRSSKANASRTQPPILSTIRDRDMRGPPSRGYFARSRSLDDVRESGDDSNVGDDNDLSFDVENTLLTVGPSDASETGGDGGAFALDSHHRLQYASSSSVLPTNKDARAIREQLGRLETMYHDVIKHVGADRQDGKVGGAQRRWSIASSDTSSLRRVGKHVRGSHGGSARSSKDLRSIQRRFQRLESHVVTLARSLAHLSSELRAHNTLRRDLEGLRREVRELKQQGPAGGAVPDSPAFLVPPFEKFRGWIPSLTNPKRINKLTQFFGQEPPLLEIFLTKLGYERYVKNFAAEHIGMIELPYMTEERLESIGIPMGPRLRILQESQLCFRQENFNIYIV